MKGTIRVRLAVIAGLAALVGLVAFGSVARADSTQEFTLDIDPAAVAEGNDVDFTFTITNVQTNNVKLGSFRIPVATEFTFEDFTLQEPAIFDVTSSAGDPWTVKYDADGDFFQGSAEENGNRLEPDEWVSFTAKVKVPANSLNDDDADTLVTWPHPSARKGNSYEQDNTTNNQLEFRAQDRAASFVFRDGGVITTASIATHQTLVINGEQTDCANGPCEGEDSQASTFITVSIPECDAGTLIVDATGTSILGGDQTGAAAVINFLYDAGIDVSNCIGQPLIIDFQFDKTVDISPGSAVVVATYGDKDITEWDESWGNDGGDGKVLPSCSKDITINCVEYVKGGPDGVRARVIGVLTPIDGGFSFR